MAVHAAAGGWRPTSPSSPPPPGPTPEYQLLDPERLLQAIASAASRRRQQLRDALRTPMGTAPNAPPSLAPSEADLMFLDVAFAGTLAGLRSGAFTAQQLASLVGDMATLAPPATLAAAGGLPAGWGDALLAATQDQLPSMPPSELAPCLEGLRRLGLDPGPEWLAALLQRTQQRLSSLDAADLSALLSHITALGYRPNDSWLDALCARSLDVGLGAFSATQLADFAAALAACNYRPPPAWLEQLVFGALLNEPQFVGMVTYDAARVLWAICSFQVVPDPVWARACFTQCLVDMELLSPEWQCNLLWSVAVLQVAQPPPPEGAPPGYEQALRGYYRPPPSWLHLLLQVSVPHARTLGNVQVVKALWAAAALQLRPPAAWLVPVVERARQLLSSPSTAAPTPRPAPALYGSDSALLPARPPEPPRTFEPLEVLYLARCGDSLYNTLAGGTPDPAAAPPGGGTAGQQDGERDGDEYDRLGPPPSLALLVREAYQAVTVMSTSSSMPSQWRKINTWYPPYALPMEGAPGMAEGPEGGEGPAQGAAPFGPVPVPGIGPRRR